MAMVPVQVRRPLDRLRDRLHAIVDRLPLGRRADDHDATALVRPVFSGPALDVEETDNELLVRAELPGLRPEDFTVEATSDRLIIRGEKGEEREEQGRGFYRLERRAGAFMRSIALPSGIDPARATATYRDGVLRLALPKTEAAKARRVQVKVAA